MAVTGNSFARGSEKDFAAAYPFLQQPSPSEAGPAEAGRGSGTAAADRRLVLRFALLLMLYQPASAKGPANPLAAAQAAAGGGGSSNGPQPMDVDAAAAAVAGLPPGMSRQDVAAVEGKAAPTGVGCTPCTVCSRHCTFLRSLALSSFESGTRVACESAPLGGGSHHIHCVLLRVGAVPHLLAG